jgi:6-phosphogluconate dehydrogenase
MGIAIPTLTAAVEARALSARRDLRQKLAPAYGGIEPRGDARLTEVARDALWVAKVLAYAQGFDLLAAADREHQYGLQMSELARIWKAGCIIRAALLDTLRAAYAENPGLEHLLLAPAIAAPVRERAGALRRAVGAAQERGIAVPALSAALAYYDAMRRERLPAALVQAQRDLFGAHTYQRTDRDGTFHTSWSGKS